ncbi:hypothetical protein TKK_0002092 [Trichogramma kaykai]
MQALSRCKLGGPTNGAIAFCSGDPGTALCDDWTGLRWADVNLVFERTSDSRFMRPIVKLIKLPTDLKLKSDSQPEVKKN